MKMRDNQQVREYSWKGDILDKQKGRPDKGSNGRCLLFRIFGNSLWNPESGSHRGAMQKPVDF